MSSELNREDMQLPLMHETRCLGLPALTSIETDFSLHLLHVTLLFSLLKSYRASEAFSRDCSDLSEHTIL